VLGATIGGASVGRDKNLHSTGALVTNAESAL
jgi:hypothetical protein